MSQTQANEIIKKRDALSSARSPRLNNWNELAPLFTQFRSVYDVMDTDIQPGDWQFDSAPKQAVLTCANGLASLIFPREEEFAEFAPPTAMKDDDAAVSWYRQCSAIHQTYLQNSNFWEENQEGLIELPVFGTMALFVGGYDDVNDELFFRHLPIGTYYISENYKGYVDTLYRDLEYTADQAANEFGYDVLPQEIQKLCGKANGATQKFKFIHAVEPRKDKRKKGGQKDEKPFTSVVVYEAGRKVVKEDGFDSFPYAVVRFRKQRNNPWGWGPASTVLGDARQLNKLNELSDIGTEISVFPPVVADAAMEGGIDMGALGINYRPEGSTSQDPVKQLPINNRLDQCDKRMLQKEEKINKAMFVDMFTMFAMQSQQPGEITAFQANQMLGEKMAQFSPVYGRIISEGGDIIMRRNFESLLAAGKFPPPPESVLDVEGDGNVIGIAEPGILYKNRIVLAQQMRKNAAIPEVMSMVNMILTTNPELAPIIYAGFELPVMTRGGARNAGWPEEWLAEDSVLKKRVEAIILAQEQDRKGAAMEQGAKTLAEASKANPNALQGAAQVLG